MNFYQNHEFCSQVSLSKSNQEVSETINLLDDITVMLNEKEIWPN